MDSDQPRPNPKRSNDKAQPLAQINHSSAKNKRPDPDLGKHGPVVSEPNGTSTGPVSDRGAK